MRRPHWRNDNEENWGLDKLTWKDWGNSIFPELSTIFDPIKNKMQKRKIRNVLKKYNTKCVSLGSGKEPPENWIGFDRYKSGNNVFSVNLLFNFPLKDNSIDALLAEHILEHFYLDDLESIFRESFRVLVSGGKIRVVSPNAKNIARLILLGEEAEKDFDVITDTKIHKWPEDGLRWARTINRLSHQWGEHKSLLMPEMLKFILEKVGFQKVTILSVKESKFFDIVPDIHQKRFPNDSDEMNFAIEAIAVKERCFK